MAPIQTRKRVLCNFDGTIESCEGYAPDSPLHRGWHITEFFYDAGDWQRIWKLAQDNQSFELTYPLKLSGQLYESTAQWNVIESAGRTYLSAENKQLRQITMHDSRSCKNIKSDSTLDRLMPSPDNDRSRYQYVAESLDAARSLFDLPAGCDVTIDRDTHDIIINCLNPSLARDLLRTANRFGKKAVALNTPCVRILFSGVPICAPLPTELLLHPVLGASLVNTKERSSESIELERNPNGLYIIKDPCHLSALIRSNPNIKVIRWTRGVGGGIGVASGANCLATSGITAAEWIGKPMMAKTPDGKNTWITEEWVRFSEALFTHSYINGFDYQAHFYTGELAEFSVRAWLCEYQGEIHRVVESLGCRLI